MSISRKLMTVGGGGPTYVDDVFSTYLYKGNGFSGNPDPNLQIVDNGIDLSDKGGLVWIKSRTAPVDHELQTPDAGYSLSSNSSAAAMGNGVLEATSDGFNILTKNILWNALGEDYASWTFAKQEGFFDVVTYTGDGVHGRDIPHALGTAPGMMIIKSLGSGAWYVWHQDIDSDPQYDGQRVMYLNLSNARSTADDGYMASTVPTDSVFTTSMDHTNKIGEDFVAYLFADDAPMFGPNEDESIIKCGSYTGNGSSDGPEIDLGWEPQWLLIKSSTRATSWVIVDSMRGFVTEGIDSVLVADNTNIEVNTAARLNPMATGFKNSYDHEWFNSNGETYIYMAVRRPNKPAEEFEPDELFAMANSRVVDPAFVSGFPVDGALYRQPLVANSTGLNARLIQDKQVSTNSTNEEEAKPDANFDYQDGYYDDMSTGRQSWMFKRAPGFFDVVTYAGNGATTESIAHNLAAVPEMYWIKRRDFPDGQGWMVYHKDAVATTAANAQSSYLTLNSGDSAVESTSRFGNIAPTTTTFGVAGSSANETGADYIAFLWASVPGICDIGSYTGTGAGTTIDIDCGFTNGARFILIKRTDGVGDWYYWDTLRGITTGADSYLALNKTNAATTVLDWIDPLGSGFTVTSSAGNDVNINGGKYIYMAIA